MKKKFLQISNDLISSSLSKNELAFIFRTKIHAIIVFNIFGSEKITFEDLCKNLNSVASRTTIQSILIDGVNAWEEFNWIGKNITIGEAVLKVFKRTQRCAATNVNHANAQRDINIPYEINSHYGHLDLGIYAKVTQSGLISVLDKLNISK